MGTLDLLYNVSSRNNKTYHAPFKENWHGLYHKDSQFTYPDATLIVSKQSKKK